MCESHRMPEDLIGSADAAAILGVDRATLLRWASKPDPKIAPAMRLPGATGACLFRRADVLALVHDDVQVAS